MKYSSLPIQLWKTTVSKVKYNKETSVMNGSYLEQVLLWVVQWTRLPPEDPIKLFSATVCNPR